MTTRLNEIRARLAAATAGPWRWEGDTLTSASDGDVLYFRADVVYDCPEIEKESDPEDDALIANAPTDIVYLLQQLDRAQTVIKAAYAVLPHADWVEIELGEALSKAVYEYYEGDEE